ncbi:hypothetical protein [Pseudomonas sp. RIT-PI-S]|uniref:hypothetical protein n=1 Tax=Pseudomonas sp. RIT-PI-S TaxID=3035295 RepID=UPI0021DA8B81|nr:hypothetical protein [Pseudomonas sp. RIT-PI-S]
MFNFLDDGKSALLKRVYNAGTSTAFIKVTVQEILIDEQGNQRELPPQALGSAPLVQHNTLIASPARLIVPAGGRQSTRLLFLGQRPKERYFRVRFMPVLPNNADRFDLSDAQQQAYKQALSAGVTVLSGFGTVLFVRPDQVTYNTRLLDEANGYSVHNTGNSVVVLDHFKDCALKDPTNCKPLTQHYVLPGHRFRFTKLPDRAYSFVLQEGEKEQPVTVGHAADSSLAATSAPQLQRK